MPPVYPKAGVLAPKEEKLFVQGVTAYMQERYAGSLRLLQDSEGRDQQGEHVGEEFFAGMCLIKLDRLSEASAYFETVLASDHSLPDPMMTKYGIGGDMLIGVTPAVTVTVPMSNLAVALMLAEVYQGSDQKQKAIELLESLGSQAPAQPVFALSLADLYVADDKWDDVVRVTEGVTENTDDVSLNILAFRAAAMVELGLGDAALALTKECLKSKKRNPDLLLFARYMRGRAYDALGKAGMAKREFEKVYAEHATFADVAQRLGREQAHDSSPPPRPDVERS